MPAYEPMGPHSGTVRRQLWHDGRNHDGDAAGLGAMRTIQCWREPGGALACNIPHRHRHHSLTGFECGYLGAGPADLALNILALFIPAPPDPRPRLDQELPQVQGWDTWEEVEHDRIRLHDGSWVSRDAWLWHQAFKRQFIATMDRAGGAIPGVVIEAWIVAKLAGRVGDERSPGSMPDQETTAARCIWCGKDDPSLIVQEGAWWHAACWERAKPFVARPVS